MKIVNMTEIQAFLDKTFIVARVPLQVAIKELEEFDNTRQMFSSGFRAIHTLFGDLDGFLSIRVREDWTPIQNRSYKGPYPTRGRYSLGMIMGRPLPCGSNTDILRILMYPIDETNVYVVISLSHYNDINRRKIKQIITKKMQQIK